ncbi:MAG: hypothetical protein LCH81_05635 [Bacteroidetes bacterium]|jgi:FtsZ-interacting cell division protein ZipA|nr:hypothetical protein [Bacteroidota bacterium]
MLKHGKKSITDLIATKSQARKPSVAEIDAITSKIHESGKEKSQPLPVTEKVKRISVNAPIQLYIKAKTKSTIQDQTLMAYILRLIEEDVKN